ncbi:MAG: M4 family metallopeptidase [Planctomycetota bacterium]|nr:M4 family metallopeptidase [Planctomycetota bacterium]
MRTKVRLVIVIGVCILASGQVSPPGNPPDGPDAGGGVLEVVLTGAPVVDGQKVVIQFRSMEVFGIRGPWITVLDSPDAFPSWELEGGTTHALRPASLPPGHYTRIRLTLGEASFSIHGKPMRVQIRTGKRVVVQIPGGFDVLEDQVTQILLDLDLDRSFRSRMGRGWGFNPRFQILSVNVQPPFKVDPATLDTLQRLESLSSEPLEFRLGQAFGGAEFLAGEWSTDPSLPDAGARAVNFVESYPDLWRLDLAVNAVEVTSVRDSRPFRNGPLTNVRLQQTYKSIPVFGADMVVHLEGNKLSFLNGTFVPDLDLATIPVITKDEARDIVLNDLDDRFRRLESLSIEQPELRILHTSILDRFSDGMAHLTWFVTARTLGPPGHWYYFVNARTGNIVAFWNLVAGAHPSKVYDGRGSSSSGDDLLWFKDHANQQGAGPLQDVDFLNDYGGIYYNYLLDNFGIDSINDGGMRLVGRANDPAAGALQACWDCRNDEAIFLPQLVTLDVVAHEYTHGLVEKMAGGLTTGVQARTLNEYHADTFAEYVDCDTPGPENCNWKVGLDTFGFTTGIGVIRDFANPSKDHWSNFNFSVTDPYTNIGIPTKVAYLIAAGGVHNGFGVFPLGVSRAQQLIYATLIDSGLSSSATFEEYRDVMIYTCKKLTGSFGITSLMCGEVFQAWCSVGLCAITQPLAGGVNESSDYFGLSLATGNFNGDAYQDLAIGAPYENYGGKVDTGVVFVFYGTSQGLLSSSSEIIAQSHVGSGANETGDLFGFSLTSGDYNNNGFDDLAIGTPCEDTGGISDVGKVTVLYGSSQGLRRNNGAVVWQRFYPSTIGSLNETGDKFGWSLATGKFNSGAYDDLAVGAPYEDVGNKVDSGFVAVLFGGAGGLSTNAERLTQTHVGGKNESGDMFGFALAAGNFDGDAYDDLAMGGPGEDLNGVQNTGMVNILYGGNGGLLPVSRKERIDQNTAFGINQAGDQFSLTLAAGNFDGDACDDLVVGAPYKDFGNNGDAGMVYILFGDQGLFPVKSERLFQNNLGSSASESGDHFTHALAVGRFNSDSFDDLVIGVPYEDVGGVTNTGLVNVMFGSAAGLFPVSSQGFTQVKVGGQSGDSDYFGWAVAAGDFDNNGKDDIAASAPWEDFPGKINNAGIVYVRKY